MIIIDQLRISDDGVSMYLDAHVNEASYFDNVYIDKVTIMTEDQVLESNAVYAGDKYVYQQVMEGQSDWMQLLDTQATYSANTLLTKMNDYGGWGVSVTPKDNATKYSLSVELRGQFSVFGTTSPKLIVTTKDYVPTVEDNSVQSTCYVDEEGNIQSVSHVSMDGVTEETYYKTVEASSGISINDEEVLFTVDGELYDAVTDPDHPVWKFAGQGEIGENTEVDVYLMMPNDGGLYDLVRLDATDNTEYLHFYYMPYYVTGTANQREIHLVLNNNSFNENFTKSDLTDNMFFVYIEAGGMPSSDTPCRLDEMTTIGVTFDYALFYNNAMCYTRQLGSNCEIPQGFIDFILNMEAMKFAIETEHYIPAIERYQWLKGSGCASVTTSKPCGCHG